MLTDVRRFAFVRAVCCSLVAMGCDEAPTFHGDLAALADSVTAGASLRCRVFGIPASSASAPTRFCEAATGDTTMSVTLDADDEVICVTRTFRVTDNNLETVALRLEQGLTKSFGQPQMCRGDDFPSTRMPRVWFAKNRSYKLVGIDTNTLQIIVHRGHSGCHEAG